MKTLRGAVVRPVSLAEYALLIALIAVVAVATLLFLSGSITSVLSVVGTVSRRFAASCV